MSETPIRKTRNKVNKVYGAGLLVFTAIMGFITVFASFLAHLNLT